MDLNTMLSHDVRLLCERENIAPSPIDNEPGGKRGQQEREQHWHPIEDLLLNGVRLLRV